MTMKNQIEHQFICWLAEPIPLKFSQFSGTSHHISHFYDSKHFIFTSYCTCCRHYIPRHGFLVFLYKRFPFKFQFFFCLQSVATNRTNDKMLIKVIICTKFYSFISCLGLSRDINDHIDLLVQINDMVFLSFS